MTSTLLAAWRDAPAILLSCPGPLRRQHAAVLPISQLTLPQCLLGGEAQLRAFAALPHANSPPLFFTPLPQMFGNRRSLDHLRQRAGWQAEGPAPLHLSFGGIRAARILTGARNGLVLAEFSGPAPATASLHPFADGATLPAATQHVFMCGTPAKNPVRCGGGGLTITDLPAAMLTADLASGGTAQDGLELVPLDEFSADDFAAGPLPKRPPPAAANVPTVLLPWNFGFPGSAVPALLERLLHLQTPQNRALRLVLYPFNDPGQTSHVVDLTLRLRQKLADAPAHLSAILVARLNATAALPALRRLAPLAWVDGNDPEHAWTASRLAACGFTTILLAPGATAAPPGVTAVAADEPVSIVAKTAFGALTYQGHLPSLRALRQAMALSGTLAPAAAPEPAKRRAAAGKTRGA